MKVKLSTRARYGLRAVLDIAESQGDRPVMLRGISERQEISAKYLEHLLADLRKAGIVRSRRGAGGGFELNREAEKISLLTIVVALETDFGTTECVRDPSMCHRAPRCPTRLVWAKVSEAMNRTLEGLTLADLRAMSRQRADDGPRSGNGGAGGKKA
ncbi:MAG: RrF2 family transcriptional regulator [Planctomycetota bacterium]|jgi:Rrf2 family protein